MLLIREVAKKTGASPSSIRVWLRDGERFPNAVLEETEFGKIWRIPETDIKDFVKRERGRPKGSKNKPKKSKSR